MKFSFNGNEKHYLQTAVIGLIVLAGTAVGGIGSLSQTAVGAKPAYLIVDAVVINDDGGTAQASDFTIQIVDYGNTNPQPLSFTAPEPGTNVTVTLDSAGRGYAVDAPGAYELGYLPYTTNADCVRSDMGPREVYLCTVYFDDGYVVPDDGEVPQDDDDGTGGNGGTDGDDSEGKVTLCHIQEGNAENAHTITVSDNSVDAHLAHGDTEGECPE